VESAKAAARPDGASLNTVVRCFALLVLLKLPPVLPSSCCWLLYNGISFHFISNLSITVMSSSSTKAAAAAQPADEAAGDEVVYASDGAATAAATASGEQAGSGGAQRDINADAVNKVRPPPIAYYRREPSWLGDDEVDEDEPVLTAEEAVRLLFFRDGNNSKEAAAPFIASSRRTATADTPTQRLEQIRQALEDVSLEVAGDEALQRQVRSLQDRLLAEQRQLQKVLRQRGSSSGGDSGGGGGEPSSAPAPAAEGQEVPSDLESLLLRLERAVGSIGGGMAGGAAGGNEKGYQNQSLLERLSALEQSMEYLDAGKLEALSRKAKVIRQDLEAASKARNKLLSAASSSSASSSITGRGGSGSAGAGADHDARTITALYDKMVELQEVSAHLPALTARLQSLSAQHADAATWASRLAACERDATRLATLLSSTESAIAQLQANWNDVVSKQLQGNLIALDERIELVKQLKQIPKE